MGNPHNYSPKNAGSVHAIQVHHDNAADLVEFCHGVIVTEIDDEDKSKTYLGINVPTVDGVVRASEGDFIFRGRDNLTRVMKGDEFLEFYERVGMR